MKYRIDDQMTGSEAKFVRQKLIEYADQFTEPRNGRDFGVALRDEEGRIVGGITANTVWDWLQISEFWIPLSLRPGNSTNAMAMSCSRIHQICRRATRSIIWLKS